MADKEQKQKPPAPPEEPKTKRRGLLSASKIWDPLRAELDRLYAEAEKRHYPRSVVDAAIGHAMLAVVVGNCWGVFAEHLTNEAEAMRNIEPPAKATATVEP